MKAQPTLRPVVHIAKFVGTISLGLLTGLSYSLSTITYPALLHLPTAPLAAQTNNYIRTTTLATHRSISTVATSALLTAFFLSPRRLRHPWLLYVALTTQLGASARVVDGVASRLFPGLWSSSTGSSSSTSTTSPPTSHGEVRVDDKLGESAVMVGTGQGSSSEEIEQDVNGEVVTREVQRGHVREKVRNCFYGLGFVMSVVGIWGDFA